MRIIIAGAGYVGREVARSLSRSRADVVLIDQDPSAIERARNIDCLTILGSALNRETLQEASLKDADVLIATASDDVLNISICHLAREVYSSITEDELPTIARVTRPELQGEAKRNSLKDWSGVSKGIGVHDEVVERLILGLSCPGASHITPFGDSPYHEAPLIAEVMLKVDGRDLVQRTIAGARELLRERMPNILAITNSEGSIKILSPDDTTVNLQPKHRLHIATPNGAGLREAIGICGHTVTELANRERVLILGHSAAGFGEVLALRYLEDGHAVTYLTPELDHANRLSGQLTVHTKHLDILHGDPHDEELLEELDVSGHTIGIACTEDDHDNLGLCLLASNLGVRKTGAILRRPSLLQMAQKMSLTYLVNERQVVVESILQHLRDKHSTSTASMGTEANLATFVTTITDHQDNALIDAPVETLIPDKEEENPSRFQLTVRELHRISSLAFIARKGDQRNTITQFTGRNIRVGDVLTFLSKPEELHEVARLVDILTTAAHQD